MPINSVLFALLVMLIALAGLPRSGFAADGTRYYEWKFPPEPYEQEVTITFDSEEAAREADVAIAPLFEGYRRAVTCRWDDNHPNNLRVQERMKHYGIKGTWYLNRSDMQQADPGDFVPAARELLANGDSIGGHTVSHPYLTHVTRNRAFWELAGIRIDWEDALDTRLNSFTFSFVDYRSQAEGDAVHRDLLELLERAGLYHIAEGPQFYEDYPSDLPQSIIMPPENMPFDVFKQGIDWAFSDPAIIERFPSVSNSMHAWYGTELSEYGLDELDKRLEYMAALQDVWRCTQNEYAAYAYQQRHSSVRIDRAASVLTVRIQRPPVSFLNNAIPLTLAISGIDADAVASVYARDAQITPASRESGQGLLYNLSHSGSQRLPERVGRVDNMSNRIALSEADQCQDFPSLQALLHFNGTTLTLDVANNSEYPVSDVQVMYRLPLMWAEGIRYTSLATAVASGETVTDSWRPTPAGLDAPSCIGPVYYVAQLDFRYGDTPARLYATCRTDLPNIDSLPRGHFAVMGPVKPENFNADAFADQLDDSGEVPRQWPLPAGDTLAWRVNHDGYIPQDHLHAEVVRTQGNWYMNQAPVYLLRSIVNSPVERPVKLHLNRSDFLFIWLNGELISDTSGRLAKGDNEFVLAYHPHGFHDLGRYSAAFIRLADPQSGSRLPDITYRLPEGAKTQAAGVDSQAAYENKVPAYAANYLDTQDRRDGVLRVALLQMLAADTPQDNLEIADKWCRRAANQGADIALMPEMFQIGYHAFTESTPESIAAWQQQAVDPDSPWVKHFRDLARELDMAIGVTYLGKTEGAPYNALSLIDRHGNRLYTYGKIHTCDFAFEIACRPGEEVYVETLDTRHGPVEVGTMICYDREFPETARMLMLKGAEIILTPNACLLDDVRHHQFQTRAYENSVATFMTNYPAPFTGGRSVAYGPSGEQLALGGEGEEIVLAEVDLTSLRDFRQRSIWGDSFRRPHRYKALTEEHDLPVFDRIDALGRPYDPGAR